MTTTKKERSAAKALARSKRNSPGGAPTKQEARIVRQARTQLRKGKQARRVLADDMVMLGGSVSALGQEAEKTASSMDHLAALMLKHTSREDLEQIINDDLRQLARDLGLRPTTKMNKGQLIDLIESARGN